MKTSPTQSLKPHHSVRLTHPAGGPALHRGTQHTAHTQQGDFCRQALCCSRWNQRSGDTRREHHGHFEGHSGEALWTLLRDTRGSNHGHSGGRIVDTLVDTLWKHWWVNKTNSKRYISKLTSWGALGTLSPNRSPQELQISDNFHSHKSVAVHCRICHQR